MTGSYAQVFSYGIYGIDAYRYRDDAGAVAFQPLCELNARMSFGHVARALVDRIAPHAGWDASDTVRLQFGRGAVPASPLNVPLLTPDPAGGDDTCAWLSPRTP